MSPAVVAALVTAGLALMGSATAWLKSHTAQQQVQQHTSTPAGDAHPSGQVPHG